LKLAEGFNLSCTKALIQRDGIHLFTHFAATDLVTDLTTTSWATSASGGASTNGVKIADAINIIKGKDPLDIPGPNASVHYIARVIGVQEFQPVAQFMKCYTLNVI